MDANNRLLTLDYDVVVAGGGLSGVCAAIASARHGAKTALIHDRNVLGGNASSEFRLLINGASCKQSKRNAVETGIINELLLENKARNPEMNYPVWDSVLWEKTRYQKNLDLYLNTTMHDARGDASGVKELICYQMTTEKKLIFTAKVFVDSTGHGTLGFLAGAEYRIGSEARDAFNEPDAPEDGNDNMMGYTVLFQATRYGHPVPFTKPDWALDYDEEYLKLRPHYNAMFATAEDGSPVKYNGQNPLNGDALPAIYDPDAGYWWNELGHEHGDGIITDSEKIYEHLYKSAFSIWNHSKNTGNHGLDEYDLTFVSRLGARESRRLIGDYILNENDVLDNTIFGDAVAYCGWPLDVHNWKGVTAPDEEPLKTIRGYKGFGTIPYRCYYSKNIPNLMFAGRDISCSKLAMGTARVMATCSIGGQAVGTAAAMSVQYNCTPREIGGRIKELQQLLIKDDCFIPGVKNTDERDLARNASVRASSAKPDMPARNVINGVTRTVGEDSNCWSSDGISAGGEKLTLTFPGPTAVKQIRVTFDPNLNVELSPTISKRNRDRQPKHSPPELVRNYRLEILKDSVTVWGKNVQDNYQRLNIWDVPENTCGDAARLTVYATHGCPNARVFEIRVY